MRPRLNEILRQPNLFSSQNSFIYELKIVLISEAYCFGEFVFFTIWGEIHFTKTTKSSQKYTLKWIVNAFCGEMRELNVFTKIIQIQSDTSKFSSPKHLLTNWEERNFYRSLNTFEYRGSNQNTPNADQNTYISEHNTPSSLHE